MIFTGVPCSLLTFINRAITSDRTNYVGAASEGEAVAIAAGLGSPENHCYVPELRPRQLCQSAYIAQLSVSHSDPLNHDVAGQPGVKDEPQHELMSQITQSL